MFYLADFQNNFLKCITKVGPFQFMPIESVFQASCVKDLIFSVFQVETHKPQISLILMKSGEIK